MKKTLLASALMLAFSSLAVAQNFEGQAGSVTDNQYVGDKIIGGWKADSNGNFIGMVANFNSSVVINSTSEYDDIVGGNYSKTTKKDSVTEIASTSLVIQNAVTKETVIGGSRFSDGQGTIKTGKTTLEIQGGTIGVQPHTGQILTGVIFAGDQIKLDTGANDGTPDGKSVIGETNLTISGGTFNSLVFGGSCIQDWYENTDGREGALMEATVDQANIDITGGVFNYNLYAGGYAEAWNGQKSTNVVKKVNLNISGEDTVFNGDIYLGGLEEKRTKGVSVGEATVIVKNAKIGNLYGYSGYHLFNNIDHDYTVNKDKPVDTDLTLINATAENVEIGKGTVTLRAEGAEGGVFVTNAQLGDGVTLLATADGAFSESINGDMQKAKEAFKFGNYDIGNIKMEEGEYLGAVYFDENGNVVKEVNAKTKALQEKITVAPQMITRIMMNDLRKRMGDVRAGEGTNGAWARYNGGQMSGQGMDADFHMVQVGIDTVPVADAPRFGVAFSYAQTESEDGYGTTDMDSYSLAFYGTKMYDNGMFVDVIGRMATMDTEMDNAGNKGKMDNVALSLSGELGWRFDVTDRFFFEPSVEATYTYMNADTFTMSNGVNYELEATDSLVGRAGFAAGFKCPYNFGEMYVRAAVVHEFMGDVTMNSWKGDTFATPVVADGKDTWFEYAIGVNFNVSKNTYVYADVERTEGAAMDEDWRANVGVRFAF